MGNGKSTKTSSVAPIPAFKDRRGRPRGNAQDVGVALRAAYDNAVDEEIPPEMLDLLSKLR